MEANKEIWKDIDGYEGLYKVSSYGNVLSLKYCGSNRKHLLAPNIDHRGYLMAHLSKRGKTKTFKIHRLVASAFIPNPDNLPQVNHKDGDKLNNCVDNLEWCTCSYNVKHAYDTGLSMPYWKGKKRDPLLIEKLRNTHIGKKQDKEWIQKRTGKQKGENHPYAKKVTQYDLQGNFIREYNLVKEAAEANGLKLNNVSACLRGKSKTSGGYIWKYANLK